MESETRHRSCPDCGAAMRSGFVGPPAYLRWWDNKKTVWTEFGVLSGESLAVGWFRNVPADRCMKCGLVIYKGLPGE